MRTLCLLFLLALPASAEPLTFEFFGAWQRVVEDCLLGLPTPEIGEVFSGEFTFNRDDDGAVSGYLTFALGSLVFEPFYLVENADGWGVMAGRTVEPACHTSSGDLPCYVLIAFRGPQEAGGGDGTRNHYISIFGDGGAFAVGPLASSRNVEIGPYLPFSVADVYFVPEPASIVLVGLGLLVLLRANRPAVIAARLLVVGAVAGAAAVLVAVWRLI